MKLTGAAVLVSRGMKVSQAAPAAYPYRSATESTVETLRWVLVGVAAVYWVCCLALHVVVAATLPGPLPGYTFAYWFVLTIVVGGVGLNVLKPPGRGENAPAPRWYTAALGVFALIGGLWPPVVGPVVPRS